MPNLEQLSLPPLKSSRWAAQEPKRLAASRAADWPPIVCVPSMPEAKQWGTVAIDVPFEAANDLLGVQLSRRFLAPPRFDYGQATN